MAFIKAEVVTLREDLPSDAGFNPTMIAIANRLADMIDAADEGFAEDGW